MPILDSEPYHQANTAYILGKIEQQIIEDGKGLDEVCVFHFNIYTGGKFLQWDGEGDTYDIARKLDFATVWLVFHQVERGEVVKCANDFSAKQLDDCITVLWALPDSVPPHSSQIESALNFADDVISKIETLNGLPCPIPLHRNQLTDHFELGCHYPKENTLHKVQIIGDHGSLPKVDGDSQQLMLYLQGYLEDIDENLRAEPYQILKLAAEWQRQTIRAIGTGVWSSAIVAANTWVEVFAVRMAVLIHEKIEDPIDDLRKELNSGLHRFITKHIGAIVKKGHWDHTRENTEIHAWFENCYMLRHKVVHQGHLPTEEEVWLAYDAAHGFVRFLTKSMASIKDERLNEALKIIRAMQTSTQT